MTLRWPSRRGLPRLLALLVACAAGSAGWPTAPAPCQSPSKGCLWSSYNPSPAVTSWEFQLDCPDDKVQGRRDEVLARVVGALSAVAQAPSSSLTVDWGSLRTSVFHQRSHAVSTLDGRPLFPGRESSFFWRQVGFLRLRHKLAWQAGLPPAHAGPAAPGSVALHAGEAGARPAGLPCSRWHVPWPPHPTQQPKQPDLPVLPTMLGGLLEVPAAWHPCAHCRLVSETQGCGPLQLHTAPRGAGLPHPGAPPWPPVALPAEVEARE